MLSTSVLNARTNYSIINKLAATADKNPTAVDYYNQALAENSYGNAAAAMEKINKSLELKPDYANALSYRGYFYELAKEYDKAIVDYLAADKLKANVNGMQVATTYAKLGKKQEAFTWLEKCLSIEYNRPDMKSLINNADFESLKGDTKWKEITSKDWYSPFEKLMIEGREKTNAKDLPGALEIWNKTIQLNPTRDEAYNARAVNYIYQGKYENALKDINQAISLKEKSEYFGNRAYIYKQLERFAEAMPDYEKAVQLDPENIIQGDRALVRFKLKANDPGIEEDLKTYLSVFHKDDFNWYFLGIYYYNSARDMEALNVLNKAININNSTAAYYNKRADVLFSLKYFDKAIADCTKSIELEPKDGKPYYTRGVIYAEQMKKQDACYDFKKAKDLGFYDENKYYENICK